jgi:TonB-linked SusC/RagA family outer membrane protein
MKKILLFLISLILVSENSFSQVKKVGKVINDDGIPLSGVFVIEKGTKNVVTTNDLGLYVFNASSNSSTVVFSYLGYETKEFLIPNLPAELTLKERVKGLNDVVVVGYGSQRKRDITGSVVSLDKERLQNLPNTNFAQALQGAIAGVSVTTTGGGAEGNSNSILIRGRNSISASSSPLIIWDGIIYVGGISEINPNDIESIEILKDASAVAIYGAKGSNGVILITSKQGKKGKFIVTYDGSYGIQTIAKRPDLLSGEEFYQFKINRKNIPAGTITPSELEIYKNKSFVDWYDLATRTGTRNQQNISVSGATDKANFYIGLTYLDVQGIAINDQFKRYSLKNNLEFKLNQRITLSSSSQLSFQDRTGLPADFSGQFGASFANPLTNPYNSDGSYANYAWPEYNAMGNPMSQLYVKNRDYTYRLFSVNSLKYQLPFIKNLSYKLNLGVEFENTDRKTYYGRNTATGYEANGKAITYRANQSNVNIENIINYNYEFKKHTLNATVLYSAQSNIFDRDQLTGVGFTSDVLTNYQMDKATLLTPSSTYAKHTMVSQMFRINYSYDSRLLLTFTMRRDGSSEFGNDRKYGTFPSVAVAWNIFKEPFMKSFTFLNNLKIRSSYGLNGQNALSSYQSLATLIDRNYVSGSSVWVGEVPKTLANPELRWESKKSWTLGIDYGFLNNKIQGSIDYYVARSSDLLLVRSISSVQGISSIWQNIGKTGSKGFEISISSINIKNKNWSWSTNANFSFNKNWIIDLYGTGKNDTANAWFMGSPINVIFDKKYDGVFKSYDEVNASAQKTEKPGYVRVLDANNDGVIDAKDRVVIGNTDPKYIWGITNTIKYKQFSLMIFVQGVAGLTKENALMQDDVFIDVRRNTVQKDWWSTNNPNGAHWSNDQNANKLNIKVYESGSFARLKDISLSYQVNPQLLEKSPFNTLRAYLSIRNLATFTKYGGIDPEITNQNDIPLQREFLLGVNATIK